MTPETGSPRNGVPVGDVRRPWRIGVVGLVVAVVAALLLGYAGGWLTPRLTHPGDASVEAGFARDMSSHHAQAVEMGMLAHEKSTNADVRLIGADIALTQQAQIGMMQTWLRDWGLAPTGSQPRMAWMPDGAATVRDGLMPGMATEAQMAQLRAASGTEFDVLFLTLMRQHHLGGIHMAEAADELADDGDVRWLAETMVDGQQREITDIQSLLTRLGG
jgi:uncharacterized protein (DUF305 family)